MFARSFTTLFKSSFEKASKSGSEQSLHTLVKPVITNSEESVYQIIIKDSKPQEIPALKQKLENEGFFVKDHSTADNKSYKTSDGKPYFLASRRNSIDLIKQACDVVTEANLSPQPKRK